MKRRSFLGFLGIAPVAGPAAAANMARNAMSPSPVGAAVGGSTDAWQIFQRSPDYMALVKRSTKLEARRYGRIKTDNGLDPDIAVLRSLPLTTKIRMQIEREVALEREQSLVDRAIEQMRERLLPGWAQGLAHPRQPRWFHESREDD